MIMANSRSAAAAVAQLKYNKINSSTNGVYKYNNSEQSQSQPQCQLLSLSASQPQPSRSQTSYYGSAAALIASTANTNRMSPGSDESTFQPSSYYQVVETRNRHSIAAAANAINANVVSGNPCGSSGGTVPGGNTGPGGSGGVASSCSSSNSSSHAINSRAKMRSLPGSVYRGSPERSLTRSPERHSISNNPAVTSAASHYRPSTSSSSTSSATLMQTKLFKASMASVAHGVAASGFALGDSAASGYRSSATAAAAKAAASNCMSIKRSFTSCDAATGAAAAAALRNKQNYSANEMRDGYATANKTRPLQLGKAKIELNAAQQQGKLNTFSKIKPHRSLLFV
jgi:hypothetical protein